MLVLSRRGRVCKGDRNEWYVISYFSVIVINVWLKKIGKDFWFIVFKMLFGFSGEGFVERIFYI